MSRTPRSAEALHTELHALTLLKLQLVRVSSHGVPQQAAVDAQLRVLKARLTEQDIYRVFGDDDCVLDAALYARQWVTGDEALAPSLDWAATGEC